ncbi:MAG: IS200/IS605 family transposase [Balneolaceae bacterium]
MSQSISKIYIHLTFGTKNRSPWINDKVGPDMHAYMASIFKATDSPALIINSVSDHVRALFRLSRNVALSKVIEEVKKNSSKWMKTQPGITNQFYWQRGYGAFSVSGSKIDVVSKYIANQQQHHMKMTYKEEIEKLMKRYNVAEYDPQYFWK